MAFDVGAVVAHLQLETAGAQAQARQFVRQLQLDMAGAQAQQVTLGTGMSGVARTSFSQYTQTAALAYARLGNVAATTAVAYAGLGDAVTTTAVAYDQLGKVAAKTGAQAQSMFMRFNAGDAVMAASTGNVRWLATSLTSLGAKISLVVAALLALTAAAKGFRTAIDHGIEAIDRMRSTAAQMAASIQTAYPEAPFERAIDAANSLIPLVERLDVLYSGTGRDLTELANAMLRYGAAADVMRLIGDETGETATQFVALAVAIKAQTGGLNFQLQVQQEIRALMSGTNSQGAQLLRILQSQNAEVKDMAASWGQQGTLLENIAPYLEGYVKASREVSELLSSQRATWQTIIDRLLRTAVLPAYEDVVSLQQAANKLLFDQQGQLTEIGKTLVTAIQGAWEAIRLVMVAEWELLKLWAPECETWSEVLAKVTRQFLTILNVAMEIRQTIMETATLQRDMAMAILRGDWSGLWDRLREQVTWSSRFIEERERIARVGATEGAAPPWLGGLGDPRAVAADEAEAHKAAIDALNAAKELLQTKIESALTDAERIAAEEELAALYHRFANDARLTQVERNRLVGEELKLRRQVTREQFEFVERDLEFRRETALSYEAERAALEGLRDLYSEMAASAKLTQAEHVAANLDLFGVQQSLAELEQDHAEAMLRLEAARAQTWEQQRTQVEHVIQAYQAEAVAATTSENRRLELQADILDLRRQLWEGDEAHLQTLYDINLAEATTFAQQRALIAGELARTRAAVGDEGLTESQRNEARQRAVVLQHSLNTLNAEAVTLQREYAASLRLSTAETLALYDQRIADQQAIIDNAQSEARAEGEIITAQTQINALTRERAEYLLRQNLALVEQQIAVERAGYDEKIRLLQEAIATETELTRQVELRAEIRATGTAAVQAELDALRESGDWELMSVRQQAELVADLLELWSTIGGVALPEVQRMLTELQVEVRKLEFSVRGFLTAMSGQLRSDFQSFFEGLMDGTKRFRDLWVTVLSDIQSWLSKIISEWLWEKTVGTLLGVGLGDETGAAQRNVQAGQLMTTASVAMLTAANTMLAASTAAGGGGGGFLNMLFGAGGDALKGVKAGGIQTQPTFAMVGEKGSLDRGGSLALAGAGGGEVHHHYTINAVDAASFVDLAHRNRSGLASALQTSIRENSPLGRRR